MSIEDLARPEIRSLRPYASARSEGARVEVLLNANENPFEPPVPGLNRYPDPQPEALLAAMAARYGVSPSQVLATRGSDEAIDLLVRVFCRAGVDAVSYCPPTFGMYRIAARIQGARELPVPLRAAAGFALDLEGLEAALAEGARIVFLCSPNNPTGNRIDEEQLLAVAAAARDRALVVVDEAYQEFSGAPGLAARITAFENLAVLRTLSKAYGLAGARCGALLAGEAVIGLLRRVMPPYPLPTPTVEAALRALDASREGEVARQVSLLVAAREALAARLAKHPRVRRVHPSDANFLLVAVDDPGALLDGALAAGIALRDMRSHRGLEDCVRISVGTAEELDRLGEVLDHWAAAGVEA